MKPQSIIFIVSVAVALLFAWYFVWPVIQSIDAAQEAIGIEKENIETLKDAQTRIKEQVDVFGNVSEEDKELLRLASPETIDKSNLAVVLNRMVQENGLVVSLITITEKRKSVENIDGLSRVIVTMKLEGDLRSGYISFKEFIKKVEKTIRIFDIERIEILPPENASQSIDKILDVGGSAREDFNFFIKGQAYFINNDDK